MEHAALVPACHRLAGQPIWIDPGLPELLPFRCSDPASPPPQIPTHLSSLAGQPPSLRAEGWVAEHFSTVSVWQDEQGILTEVPTIGRFWTAADGSTISMVTIFPGSSPALRAEALLGPPLVLALALNGTWCLHASAVEIGGQCYAFLGGSGAGKSTLAAFLGGQPGVRRVADDILPVGFDDRQAWALPRFPQLKLPIRQQPGAVLPERLPLAAVFLLDEQPTLSIEPLRPGNSALLLAGQTVAARLFDRQLLARHLDFCIQAAPLMAARRLAYPRRLDGLPEVWKALQSELAALPVASAALRPK
jgi:hypothetical protein